MKQRRHSTNNSAGRTGDFLIVTISIMVLIVFALLGASALMTRNESCHNDEWEQPE